MKNLKKTTLILLSTLPLVLGFMNKASGTEDTKESLEQRLGTLKQENNQAEIASLKAQIAEEEKKKADREGTTTPTPQSQSPSDQSATPQDGDKKSTWVRERDRVEDQAKDKWEKVKNIF